VSGSGKTHTGTVLSEEMLYHDAHVAVVDPLGVWWGLRAARSDDADAKPLPIYIFGGSHADLPLDSAGGAAIAELVVQERLSVILDVSEIDDQAEQASFVADFLERLYALNRDPLHLIVDEADIFVPETPGSQAEARSRRALDRVVRRGRVRGLGVTMLSQRAAVVAKNVLTQIGTLVAHRMSGPQDRKAVEAWLKANATPEQMKEVLSSLPSLQQGECWLWSPADLNILERIRVRDRRTYDSSATPKMGVRRAEARRLDAPDLTALRNRLAASIQRAEDNDPEVLKQRVADLERQLRDRPTEEKEVIRTVEIPVLEPGQLEQARAIADGLIATAKDMHTTGLELMARLDRLTASPPVGAREEFAPAETPSDHALTQPITVSAPESDTKNRKKSEKNRTVKKPSSVSYTPRGQGGSVVSGPQQAMLNALAEFESLGIRRVLRSNLGAWVGVSAKGSGFRNNLSALRSLGLVDYPDGGTVALTADGLSLAAPVSRPPSRRLLIERWKERLSGPQGLILDTLLVAYPNAVRRDNLAETIGVSPAGSGYRNNLSAMRSLGLIDYPTGGTVILTDLLFPAGLPE
jgi:uncharacterized protein